MEDEREKQVMHHGSYTRVRRKRRAKTTSDVLKLLLVVGIAVGAVAAGFLAIVVVNTMVTLIR